MRLKFTIWLLASSFLFSFTSEGQVFEWAKKVNTTHWFSNKTLVTDNAGNVIVCGNFTDSLVLGTYQLNLPGTHAFIAKLDDLGNVIWVKNYLIDNPGPILGSNVSNLSCDASGNIYFAGGIDGNNGIHIDNYYITTPSGLAGNRFFVKLNSTGNVLWIKESAPGNWLSYMGVGDLKVDAAGNCFIVSGSSNNSYPFIFNSQSYSGNSTYLLKLNPSGNLQWVKQFPAITINSSVNFVEIAMDVAPNGICYLTGAFKSPTLDFGDGIVLQALPGSNNSFRTSFFAKYNSSGTCLSAIRFGTNTSTPEAIAVNNAGEVTITGRFRGDVSFNSVTLTTTVPFPTPPPLYSAASFILKMDASGTVNWIKEALIFSKSSVRIDGAGNIIVAAKIHNPAGFDQHWLYPVQGTQDIALAKYLANGNVDWVQSIESKAVEHLGNFELDNNGNVYLITSTYDSNPAMPNDTTSFGHISLPYLTEGTSYISKLTQPANRITGTAFADLNSSGTKEINEPFLPVLPIEASGLPLKATNSDGRFSFFTLAGNYQLTIPNPPAYFSSSPSIHTVGFSSLGQTDSANHFALQPTMPVQDVMVQIVPLSPARPGFLFKCRINYTNVGSLPVSGQLKFVGDDSLTFLAVTPINSGTAADTLIFQFSNLQPFESRSILAEFNAPAATPLGTQIQLYASLQPQGTDQNSSDNAYTLDLQVVGSFDPNDKLVSQSEISLQQIQNHHPLIFTIRFQNTGTDTAFTVHIRDELPDLLDFKSIEVLSSSHPLTWSVSNQRTVEWHFSGIALPDSNTNKIASHGYLQYQVRAKATTPVGEHILTKANIYFDYNAPVITNTTDTEVTLVNSVNQPTFKALMGIYPNPNSGQFTVRTEVRPGPVQVILRNLLGQIVMQTQKKVVENSFTYQIDVENLPSGVYLIELLNAGNKQMQKVILQ